MPPLAIPAVSIARYANALVKIEYSPLINSTEQTHVITCVKYFTYSMQQKHRFSLLSVAIFSELSHVRPRLGLLVYTYTYIHNGYLEWPSVHDKLLNHCRDRV